MKLGHLIGLLGGVALAVSVGWTAISGRPEAKVAPVPQPVSLRFWPTAKIEKQLAPKAANVDLGFGAPCHAYAMQQFKRIVIVCS